MTMSLGEDRVRITFNPGNNDAVAELKQRAAELIDIVDVMKAEGKPELNRLVALAQTCFEDGAMWAVKAYTVAKE
jgi:hypothetical protein